MPICVCCASKATHAYLQYPVCYSCFQHQQLVNLVDQGISYEQAYVIVVKKSNWHALDNCVLPWSPILDCTWCDWYMWYWSTGADMDMYIYRRYIFVIAYPLPGFQMKHTPTCRQTYDVIVLILPWGFAMIFSRYDPRFPLGAGHKICTCHSWPIPFLACTIRPSLIWSGHLRSIHCMPLQFLEYFHKTFSQSVQSICTCSTFVLYYGQQKN